MPPSDAQTRPGRTPCDAWWLGSWGSGCRCGEGAFCGRLEGAQAHLMRGPQRGDTCAPDRGVGGASSRSCAVLLRSASAPGEGDSGSKACLVEVAGGLWPAPNSQHQVGPAPASAPEFRGPHIGLSLSHPKGGVPPSMARPGLPAGVGSPWAEGSGREGGQEGGSQEHPLLKRRGARFPPRRWPCHWATRMSVSLPPKHVRENKLS